MNYLFKVEEDSLKYKMFVLPQEIKLVEIVFMDMENFARPVFKESIEKVVNGVSSCESITGNMCTLTINKDFTDIYAEFTDEGVPNDCRIETKELYSLLRIWIIMNEDRLFL